MRDELDELAADWAPGTHRVRRSRAGLFVILAIVVLVLAVVGVLAVTWLNRSTTPGPAERAVAYLEAIAAGDASAAIDLSATKPTGPLLTDAALAESKRIAPITNIKVVEEGPISTTQAFVVLSYDLAGKPTEASFPMVPDGVGNWMMQRATATVRIAPRPKMMPVTLDGVPLESNTYAYTVEVFPGAHKLSTGSPWLDFGGPITIGAPAITMSIDPVADPSPAYATELKKKLKERLDRCIAARDLAPAGCPWAKKAPAGQQIVRGSVRYELTGDPFWNFRAPVPGDTEAIARGTLQFGVAMTATTSAGTTVKDTFTVDAAYATDLLTPELALIWE